MKNNNPKLFSQGGVLPLTNNRYGMCLSWDKLKTTVDVDLQAVVVNNSGTICDAVYYNRLEVMDKGMSHSGDDKTGAGEGFDESIWINLAKFKKEVKLVIFVVAAHSGGSFNSVADATLHIVAKWHGNTLESVHLKRGLGGVMAVACMVRGPDGDWVLTRINKESEEGNHFMDILEPTLGDIIRKRIKGAPERQRVNFPMAKGVTADLPKASKLERVAVGVGWDMGSLGIDLDVSAVLFGNVGQKIGAVYYNNPKAYGLTHTGDNETGEGDGDDETIVVSLGQVPDAVAQIFFIVNIYTKGVTFNKLNNAYCRVCNQYSEEMAKYQLVHGGNADGTGLIIARLQRSSTGRWGFTGLGSFCQGRKWMDRVCLKEMQRMFYMSVADIMLEGGSISSPKDKLSELKSPRAMKFRNLMKNPKARATAGQSTYCLETFERTESGSNRRVRVGVGWDILATKKGYKTSVDLDVAAVFFHKEGRDIGAIDYENIEEYGMRHSGDNETGEGEGDDEVIDVELDLIPEDVAQVFFVVTVYTKGMDFTLVENAYCRVIDDLGEEVVRHDLTGSGSPTTGLVIGQFFRHPEQGWTFKKRQAFCDARSWLDPVLMNTMRDLFKETTKQYDPSPECPQPETTLSPTWTWRRGVTWEAALGVDPFQPALDRTPEEGKGEAGPHDGARGESSPGRSVVVSL